MNIDLTKYRHVIWDWNGTLIDDVWLCVEIINSILKKYNKTLIDSGQYRDVFDFPVRQYYHSLGLTDNFDSAARDFITAYNHGRFKCRLHEGAENALEYFHKAGITQHILSAYHVNRLKEAVDFYRISPYFHDLIGLEDDYAGGKIEKGKELISNLPCRPSQVLIVGDTTHDFEVADSIGTGCILLSTGHHSLQRLTACKVPILTNLGDLLPSAA